MTPRSGADAPEGATVIPADLRKKPGPKTAAAKVAVAANAVTHGIFSSLPVIPGVESVEEAEAFYHNFISGLDLVGGSEEAVGRRAAGLLWRMLRIERFEVQVLVSSMEEVDDDYRKESAFSHLPGSLDEAEEAVTDATRRFYITENIPRLPVGLYIGEYDADAIVRYLTGGEVTLPEHLGDNRNSFSTGSLLMGAAAYVAESTGDALPKVLADAVENARDALVDAATALAGTMGRLDRMRRERQSLPEHILHANARYEAGLDRAFHRCMTLLETMRAAREGRPVPLARLQVDT
jgi:hypothetical protein